MARLLDNSEKTITHIYVIAGENTRALVRLAAVNRRMRAVWLQDSDYIIARSLELQAPDHQDAIGLTLMEVCCPMPVSGFRRIIARKDEPSLRLHIQGHTRNVGFAFMIYTETLHRSDLTYKDD
jgi:hypothetical protein